LAKSQKKTPERIVPLGRHCPVKATGDEPMESLSARMRNVVVSR
jgi:hypothetical protein